MGALPIANFATYGNASLIRDLGRLYGVPREIVEKAAELGDTDDDVLEEFFAYCKPTALKSGLMLTQQDVRTAYNSMLTRFVIWANMLVVLLLPLGLFLWSMA